MKIELESMTLNNFKGIKNFTVSFKGVTNIYGENGIGKTTLFDAFRWLFFGKDSFDRKDFNIKNTVNLLLNKQDHEVSAIAYLDSNKTTFRRVLREKWVKKRGENISEFTGHETLFFINDVPFQLGEYAKKIDEILNESIFKLITDPQYFNRMKWQERRVILMDMAGKIDTTDILDKISTLQNKFEIMSLTNVLNSGKTIDEYKREISSKKKILKDSIINIPHRIDELLRSLPVEPNYEQTAFDISVLQGQVEDIDKSINDQSLAHEDAFKKITSMQDEIHSLTTKRSDMAYQVKTNLQNKASDIRIKRQSLVNTIDGIQSDVTSKTSLVNSKKSVQEGLRVRTSDLREKFKAVNAKELVFNEHEFTCPTCNRDFESNDIEAKKAEMLNNFNDAKERELAAINQQGKAMVNEVKENDDLVAKLETTIADLNAKLIEAKQLLIDFDLLNSAPLPTADDQLADNDEYIALGAKISGLQTKVSQAPKIDLSELRNRKAELTSQIQTLNKQLDVKERIESTNKRIEELKDQEKTLAQQLADLELIEFTIAEFDRAKINTMEDRINGKFRYVRFKMFEKQINGGEVEACETMIDGVPYSDANNAGRINSGLDIINALCDHYNAYAPIFIDNKESIITTIPVKSQVINLIVSEGDKALRVA